MSKSPSLLRWDIVSKCNLSCSHCCVGDLLRDDTIVDLTTEEIFRGLEAAALAGVKQIHFLGGEPTIRRDFLDIMRHSRQHGLAVSFNTNGIRQDERYLAALIEIEPVGITVSLDGPDERSHDAVRGRGSFTKTASFIRKIVSQKNLYPIQAPQIQIQSVLTSKWFANAGDLIRLASDLGVDAIVINHLAKIGDAKANSEDLGITPEQHFEASIRLLDAMREHPQIRVTAPIRLKVMQFYREFTGDRSIPLSTNECPAIEENSQVNYDGTVSPCQLAQSYGLYDEGSMPSVLRDIDSAWDSPVFEVFKHQVKSDLDKVYKNQIPCNRCAFLGRGCKPCPLPDDPNLYKTNYQCLIAEALLLEGHKKGNVADLTDAETSAIIANTVRANEPRRRPLSDKLFQEIPVSATH